MYYDPSGYADYDAQFWLDIMRGNDFNKENRPHYTYNEVRVKGNGKKVYFVVDSYEPPFFKDGEFIEGQIVSRKSTQLAEVAESTAIGYLNEADRKYSSGTEILDIIFNPDELKGKKLEEDLYLEVPEQNAPIPDAVQKEAERLGITIRENTEEHPRTSRNNANNLLDGIGEECDEQIEVEDCP